MKQILLISAALLIGAGSASAQVAQRASVAARPQGAITVSETAPQVLSSRTLSGKVKVQTVRDSRTGLVYKRLAGVEGNRISQPKRVARAEAGSGYALYEDFEASAGDGWMPEGWQALSKAETVNPWYVDGNPQFMGAQGEYVATCNFNADFIDEWLVTPTLHVESGMLLRYLINCEPLWMYSTDNIDWDTMSYVGEKTQAYTIKP